MYLYGASGHGKVIKEILRAQGTEVKAFVDDDLKIKKYCCTPVFNNSKGLSPMIVSIGDNRTRKAIVNRLSCGFGTAIHPSAVVSPTAIIREGTVVMPGAIINADAKIGKHCIINTGASVDHECVIGDYCHLAPHVTLCGQVRVGEGTLIGAGASVVPGVKIGKWCTIGANAAVIGDVADNTIVVGVPARVMKTKDGK